MQYIANIFTNYNLNSLDIIKVIPEFDEDKIDNNLPTLIIGWVNVKNMFPNEQISILNKQINKNLFWTFSKFEKRSDYEQDLLLFYDLIFKRLKKDIKYTFFNIISSKFQKKKDFINLMKSSERKIVYIHKNSFLYIFVQNQIIGVSLLDCEYLNVDKNKVINKLNNFSNTTIFNNDNFLSYRIKKIIERNTYLLPFFYNLKYY